MQTKTLKKLLLLAKLINIKSMMDKSFVNVLINEEITQYSQQIN
jgi:hypothetical protein